MRRLRCLYVLSDVCGPTAFSLQPKIRHGTCEAYVSCSGRQLRHSCVQALLDAAAQPQTIYMYFDAGHKSFLGRLLLSSSSRHHCCVSAESSRALVLPSRGSYCCTNTRFDHTCGAPWLDVCRRCSRIPSASKLVRLHHSICDCNEEFSYVGHRPRCLRRRVHVCVDRCVLSIADVIARTQASLITSAAASRDMACCT